MFSWTQSQSICCHPFLSNSTQSIYRIHRNHPPTSKCPEHNFPVVVILQCKFWDNICQTSHKQSRNRCNSYWWLSWSRNNRCCLKRIILKLQILWMLIITAQNQKIDHHCQWKSRWLLISFFQQIDSCSFSKWADLYLFIPLNSTSL